MNTVIKASESFALIAASKIVFAFSANSVESSVPSNRAFTSSETSRSSYVGLIG